MGLFVGAIKIMISKLYRKGIRLPEVGLHVGDDVGAAVGIVVGAAVGTVN